MQIRYKHYILFILLSIWTRIGLAQNPQPQKIWELSAPESTSKNYVAQESIILKANGTTGFSFSAAEGKTFTAKIDAGLLFPPTENTYALPNGQITTDPTQGAVVGSIPGQFAVSPTGAATYTIPIEVPAGINGMQPDISLVYNSQSGNGIAGWGWNISGLSSINKINKTLFSDNESRGIDLTENNRFSLDGNILFPLTENYGQDGATYQTQNKTYFKIYSVGQIEYSIYPEKFIVVSKDGHTLEYSQAVVPLKITSDQPNPSPIQWLISKSTDSNGNFIIYSYTNYPHNQTVISRIDYNGNSIEGVNTKTSIRFYYDTKSKITNTQLAGYSISDAYLLKYITVTNENDEHLRQYDIDYNYSTQDNKYFIKTITLNGLNNEKLISTNFSWGLNNRSISVNDCNIPNPSSFFSERTNIHYVSNDVDGDGISDIVEVFHGKISLGGGNYTESNYLNIFKGKYLNGNISFETYKSNINIGASFSFDDFAVNNGGVLFPNFNGSGKKSVLVPSYIKIDQFNQYYTEYKDVNSSVSINHIFASDCGMPAYATGDINNDGIDELISISSETINLDFGKIFYIKKNDYSNCNLSTSDELISDHFRFSGIIERNDYAPAKEIFILDLDQDGLNDLLITTPMSYTIYKNKGGVMGTDGIVHANFEQIGVFTGFNSKYSEIKPGDFNGDGKIDFILNEHCNSTWKLAINKGNFTFDYIALSNFSSVEEEYTEENDDKQDCIVTDFNNDGKSDVILIDPVYSKHTFIVTWGEYEYTNVKWYQSNGNGFDVFKSYTVNDEEYTYNNHNTIGDFNADGRADVFSFGSNLYTGLQKTTSSYIYTTSNTNYDANLIYNIDVGLGNYTQIRYQPLTLNNNQENTAFYTPESSAVYPINDLRVPLYCVWKTTENHNYSTVAYRDTYYSYSGGKFQLTGKGFLGFRNQTISSSLDNRKISMTTDFDYENCLPLKQVKLTKTLDDHEISKIETSYSNTKTDGIFTVNLSKIIEKNILDGLTKTTEYVNYDNFGNLKETKTTQGEIEIVQKIDYDQFGNWAWGPNMPIKDVTTRKYKGEYYIREKTFDYDSNSGHLIKETLDPNDPKQVVTEYKDYDNFGHAKTIQVKAKDINGVEQARTSYQTFTSSGRFFYTKTNLLGEITTYDWDELKGQLKKETDHWGHVTSYTYDNWGKIKETRFPDGIRKVSVLQWAGTDGPNGAFYYNYSQSSGSAPVKIWYDGFGREIQKDTYGLNNKKISVCTEYYTSGANKGKIYRVSEPYFENETKIWAITYNTYDEYGRITLATTPMGQVITDYNVLSTTVSSPEGTKTTVLNSSGLVETSTNNDKSVNYTYYPSGLTKTSIPEGGLPVTMKYNLQGQRTLLVDPDGGTVRTEYNGFGESTKQVQKIHIDQDSIITINNIDNFGRLLSINRNGEITINTYDTQFKGRVNSIELKDKNSQIQNSQVFGFDEFNRVTSVKEDIVKNGLKRTYTTAKEYDALGRTKKEIYPSGYYTINTYDQYSNLTEVKDKLNRSIWKANTENARGQLTSINKGSKETTYGFDSRGLPTSIVATGVENMSYSFDSKGNLFYRTDNMTNQKEQFTYDGMNRLTNWDVYQNNSSVASKQNSITFDATTSNITAKSDLENLTMNYGEGNGKPHALTSISGVPTSFPTANLIVTYTDFKKIATLHEGSKDYVLTYGVDDQRRKSEYYANGLSQGTPTLTRYYLGEYEEEIDAFGNVRKIHYLSGGALYIQNNGNDSLLYAYADFQGSLLALTDAAGNIVEKYAYDPWGARRNPNDWTQKDTRTNWITNRGYTGHEHIDEFGIINMNGRVYDPATAMFMSPDPYLQAPDNWLNYNRYGYCFGNPFRYTDPSGYWAGWDDIAALLIGGISNWVSNGCQFNLAGLSYFVAGAAAGIGTLYAPGSAMVISAGLGMANSIIGQGFDPSGNKFNIKNVEFGMDGVVGAGLMSAVTSYVGGKIGNAMHLDKLLGGISSPILRNVIGGQIGGSVTGAAFGGLSAVSNGQDFGQGAWNGAKMGFVTGTIGGLGAGVQYSLDNKVNLFTGKPNPVMQKPTTTKPNQDHHFATDKNKKYTPAMKEITDKYDLDLKDDWNKANLPHQGRHPNEYHNFVLKQMQIIDNMPNMNQGLFIEQFKINVRQPVINNPNMLYKDYWKW